jgi:hypothetical protein
MPLGRARVARPPRLDSASALRYSSDGIRTFHYSCCDLFMN